MEEYVVVRYVCTKQHLNEIYLFKCPNNWDVEAFCTRIIDTWIARKQKDHWVGKFYVETVSLTNPNL